MAKIKIIDKEVEIEGKVEKGKVTPFGTSAHIPFKKKHTGKLVDVVVPEKTKYIWLINTKERTALLKAAIKNINEENGRLEHYRLGLIEDLENDEFNIDSLIKILEFVNDKKLIEKIKSLYNIDKN